MFAVMVRILATLATLATLTTTTMTTWGLGMFAFLLGVLMSFVSPPVPVPLSLPAASQSLDCCPSAPNNTLDCDNIACEKSEWDMLSVALAMYKLYWVELRQKQEADGRPSKRRRTEVMPPLRRENTIAVISGAASGLLVALWNFILLVASLLPNLGVRLLNILAAFAVVFITLYIFLSRGWGDFLVRSTQTAVLGLIFPNSSALVKEF
jgi:hypothetical protein